MLKLGRTPIPTLCLSAPVIAQICLHNTGSRELHPSCYAETAVNSIVFKLWWLKIFHAHPEMCLVLSHTSSAHKDSHLTSEQCSNVGMLLPADPGITFMELPPSLGLISHLKGYQFSAAETRLRRQCQFSWFPSTHPHISLTHTAKD